MIEHDDDGSVVVRGRFAAEEGALIVAALEAAQQQLAGEHDRAGADVPAGTPAERATGRGRFRGNARRTSRTGPGRFRGNARG